MNKFPEIITFRITSECKNSCRYCYGPKNIPRLDLKKIFKIIDIVNRGGARGMVLTGGEPLLLPDIETIIRRLRSKKMNVYLDTSGENFFKHNYFIDKNVSVLGIPIDEYSEEGSYRRFGSHLRRLEVLNYYKHSSSALRPLLRVGTVVTKENLDDLEKIADLISQYPVDLWKIYQFIPIGDVASRNKKALEISSKEFIAAAGKAKRRLSRQVRVMATPFGFRSRAYFMINPDGTVFMPEEDKICKEQIIGDIFDQNITEKWSKCLSENNLISNAESTFSYEWKQFTIENKFLKMAQEANKYYKKSHSYLNPHVKWMIRESLPLLKKKDADRDILFPLIILHDVGYTKEKDNPFFSRSRIDHMMHGAQIAKKILKKVNYDGLKSEQIVNLVSKHDNWALGDDTIYNKNQTLGLFGDLHHTSALSDRSFPEMSHFLGKSDAETLEYLNHDSIKGHKFTSRETEMIHNRCYINKKFDIISAAAS
jgi:MoaA/NifB/PqqE/SkfB family radical SAM enzyme